VRFSKYPQYWDSGNYWLGYLPSGWQQKRLKHISQIDMGQSPSSDQYVENESALPFLQGNADFGPRNPNPSCFCDSATKFAHAGDVLLSVRAPVGAINVADQRYGIGRGLCSISASRGTKREFLLHCLSIVKEQLLSVATGSTYQAVSVADVANSIVSIPPLAEQEAIASFLDQETAKIDALITEQQRLIELLKEKRQAVISHAVTKGLNPDVRIKPSGVEWLG
jgi:type I restriction enzyme S subunit